MKKKYYWIAGIVVAIIIVIIFIMFFYVQPVDEYCLICKEVESRKWCSVCEKQYNWSSEFIIPDEFIDCIKYCELIDITVKSTLPKNITCKNMEYLCNNFLVD